MTDLESEVSKITMRINSNYSTLTHQPLVLLKQDISFAQFLALMSVAEVFMITSLREGMNLSGHDFISCQDGNSGIPQRYGSLILSEFTGSASIWSGHGLLVNPWDYAQCAAAINQALTMSPQEKETNWRFLTDRMTRNTASMWCKSYLTSLHQAYDGHISRELASDSSFSIDDLKEEYQISNNRMFVLEESSIFPTLKIPGSDRMSLDLKNSRVSILKSLSSDPQNAVYMTSPRTPKQLELILKELPEIGLIAENGVFLRHPGSQKTEWQQLLSEEDTRDWRWGVQRVMQYFQERTEGTYIEEDRFSLTFSYKDSLDPELAIRQSSELTHQINGSRGNVPIRAVMIADEGKVTVGPTTVTQTTTAELALQYITKEKNAAPDFLVVIGSSPRAGEMFRWANKLSQEGRVGNVINVAVGEKASTTAATVLDANGSLVDGLTNLV
jgi:trehalose 6-phosphate synthase/phosphatase